MIHQLNVTQIIKMDTPAVLFMYNDLVYFHTIHKENSRCIHLDDLDHIELVNHLPMDNQARIWYHLAIGYHLYKVYLF